MGIGGEGFMVEYDQTRIGTKSGQRAAENLQAATRRGYSADQIPVAGLSKISGPTETQGELVGTFTEKGEKDARLTRGVGTGGFNIDRAYKRILSQKTISSGQD